MGYLVLARKYRPKTFEEVLGQEAVAKTLRNAIRQDRIAHAYLFAGQRGVGKTSMARIFAKWLNCTRGPDGAPCEECESCKRIALGDDIDVLEIDGASNRGIEQVREIRDNVRYAPTRSPFKIYYIDEVHMLTPEAFNALLKTLEEPPPHVKFIFATTQAHRLPATILSRCQRFDFRPIPAARIEEHLKSLVRSENVACDDESLAVIARRAGGSMRDAEMLLDQLISFSQGKIAAGDVHDVLGTVGRETISNTLAALAGADAAAVLATVDEVISSGKDIGEFLNQLVAALRDKLVAEAAAGDRSQDAADPAELTIDAILYMMSALSGLQTEIRRGNRDRALVEMVLVKLARAGNLAPISELVSQVEALAAAGVGRIKPVASAQDPPLEAAEEPASDAASPPPDDWSAVLAALKKKNPILHAMARKADLLRVEGNRMVLSAQRWLAERLADAASRELVEQCIREVTGKKMTIEIAEVENGETRPAARPEDAREKVHPLIEKAQQLIPGRIVSRKGV